jgi:hypothetical protein
MLPQTSFCIAIKSQWDQLLGYFREHEPERELLVHTYDRLGVDNVRLLRDQLSVKYANPVRFIICATSYTTEAQNALLKSCEELGISAALSLTVSKPDILLPTLRSRLQQIDIPFDTSGDDTEVVNFCAASYGDRQKLIDESLSKKSKNPWTQDDVKNFLAACLRHVRTGTEISPTLLYSLASAEESLQTLSLPGMPAKMVFEHIALTLPKR